MATHTHWVYLKPHGTRIAVEHGSSLLKSLNEKGIFLRSDCGGKGKCGKCGIYVGDSSGDMDLTKACTLRVTENMVLEIPPSSYLSTQIIKKAPAPLPVFFTEKFSATSQPPRYGIAVDLGTTTIALYLCRLDSATVISSLSVKNPQAVYGDDVMSRIDAVRQSPESLGYLQNLVISAIEWGVGSMLSAHDLQFDEIDKMVVVGNPTMIHIFMRVDPQSIGQSPYYPAFYEAREVQSQSLGFNRLDTKIKTLPQVSGFIGGDILAAALAANIEAQPIGTLVIDIGTNGELVLKGEKEFYAASCATGPAFEGASISSGIQAVRGAIDEVLIQDRSIQPGFSMIDGDPGSSKVRPVGICGSGIISIAAAFSRAAVIEPNGAFAREPDNRYVKEDTEGRRYYELVEAGSTASGHALIISQQDIRSIQLGKSALQTGIEFLLQTAEIPQPSKIIIAGAFGSYLDRDDLFILEMIPRIDEDKVTTEGNLAGAGAVMALCDEHYFEKAAGLTASITVVDLAGNKKFQDTFVSHLHFDPGLAR